jgi:GH24 family phage-related lysozyme (muramidase)
MDQAVPQAAEGMSATGTSRALDALRLKWDGICTTGYDTETGWWTTRNGQIGSLLTAGEPDELDAAITDEYGPGR